jgi:hypothetical protein
MLLSAAASTLHPGLTLFEVVQVAVPKNFLVLVTPHKQILLSPVFAGDVAAESARAGIAGNASGTGKCRTDDDLTRVLESFGHDRALATPLQRPSSQEATEDEVEPFLTFSVARSPPCRPAPLPLVPIRFNPS